MNLNHPKVSIAVISYNQRDFIIECLNSCFNQTYSNIEVIISDDGSSDGTVELLSEIMTDYPDVKIICSEKNQGIAANCNNAWKEATGKWIKTIASDDVLELNCIERFIEYVRYKDADILFSFMRIINSNEVNIRECDRAFFDLSNCERVEYLLAKNGLPAPSSFIKKSCLYELGFADVSYSMIEDYPLWLKAAQFGKTFALVPEVLVGYRYHDSISNNVEKVGNSKYLRSLYKFKKEKVWPYRKGALRLKSFDEYVEFNRDLFFILYLGNKKNSFYNIIAFLSRCLRPYAILRKFNFYSLL